MAADLGRNPTTLPRRLGFWDVFCIASGAMISSGLFVLPGLAFAKAGPAMILAYALAAVMTTKTTMTQPRRRKMRK